MYVYCRYMWPVRRTRSTDTITSASRFRHVSQPFCRVAGAVAVSQWNATTTSRQIRSVTIGTRRQTRIVFLQSPNHAMSPGGCVQTNMLRKHYLRCVSQNYPKLFAYCLLIHHQTERALLYYVRRLTFIRRQFGLYYRYYRSLLAKYHTYRTFSCFYRSMLRRAQLCHSMSSVRLSVSVCPWRSGTVITYVGILRK